MQRPRTSTIVMAAIGIIAIGAAAFALWLAFGTTSPEAGKAFQEASVVRVVDGDTLEVRTGGTEAKLRLIGIDAPESASADADANSIEGEQASAFLASVVSPGQRVYLQADTRDTDKYERLLRYVWLEQPADPITLDDVRTKMLNGIIVVNGYAQAKRYPPDTAFAEQLEALQKEAVAADAGVSYLWK